VSASTVVSHSVAETRAEGARQAALARPGDIYALVGPLGAGKTEFVRGDWIKPGAIVIDVGINRIDAPE